MNTATHPLDIVEERAAQFGTGVLSDRELLEAFLPAQVATRLLEVAGSF